MSHCRLSWLFYSGQERRRESDSKFHLNKVRQKEAWADQDSSNLLIRSRVETLYNVGGLGWGEQGGRTRSVDGGGGGGGGKDSQSQLAV